MGANEKSAATYHGVQHNPDPSLVRTVYAGASPVPSYDERAEAFDRMIARVRAEAKAEALEEAASEIYRLDGDDAEMYDEDLNATPVTARLRARANQHKEEQ